MKSLLLFLGILFINSSFAQQPVAGVQSKSTDYYMMKNDHLLHYLSTGEVETVMSNATLTNGIVLSSNGDMTGKKAVKQKLENGECIDVDGVLMMCTVLDSLLTKKIKEKK